MALPEVSSEELYRQMANDVVEFLMGDLSYIYVRFFRQTPDELYNALTTNTLYMENFPGNIAAEAGCYIYLGDIVIQFLRLEPNHTIQLLWKLESWPDSFWSRANIIIEPTEHCTRIQCNFCGIPTTVDDAEEIWEENVWRPIIEAFAYWDQLMRWAESLE